MRYDIFFMNENINTVTTKQSPRPLFSKKATVLPFSRRETNAQSSLLVSTLKGVIALFFIFEQIIVMISLNLQAIRSLMPSKLCSRSQQLKFKKIFLYDGGKPMVNNFSNNRV